MLELRQLKAFVAIAEEGYITRAAERLGMQQPPLTRLLQSLEAQLGVMLMERLPRGVRPTTAGLALLDEARDILARAEGVADVVSRAARGERGRLAIGFTSSAALHPFVPSVLRRFREAFVGVSVVLEEAGTGELLDALVQENWMPRLSAHRSVARNSCRTNRSWWSRCCWRCRLIILGT